MMFSGIFIIFIGTMSEESKTRCRKFMQDVISFNIVNRNYR